MGVYIVTEKAESLNCFNRHLLVYEALECATAVILKIFLCKVAEILALGDKLSSKYFVSSLSVLLHKSATTFHSSITESL